MVASAEEVRAACAPALADLERSHPGLLRLSAAPPLPTLPGPWGNETPEVWLWDTDGGGGTGVWSGEHEESMADAFFRMTDIVQEAAIEAVHGAWPECPHHPDGHPLEVSEQDGSAVWVCPASGPRFVAKVGELPTQPSAAS